MAREPQGAIAFEIAGSAGRYRLAVTAHGVQETRHTDAQGILALG